MYLYTKQYMLRHMLISEINGVIQKKYEISSISRTYSCYLSLFIAYFEGLIIYLLNNVLFYSYVGFLFALISIVAKEIKTY